MNKLLFISSIIFGLIQYYYVYINYALLNLYSKNIVIFGILTSVLNHGTSSYLLKIIDRIVISIGVLLDYYLILYEYNDKLCLIYLNFAVFFYFYNKYVIINNINHFINYHFISHIFGTLFQCRLIKIQAI